MPKGAFFGTMYLALEKRVERTWQEELLGGLDLGKLKGIREGLISEDDPITWRTLVVSLRDLFGSEDSDNVPIVNDRWDQAKAVIPHLLKDTPLEILEPELLHAMGVEIDNKDLSPIDTLLVGGRYRPESIMYQMYRLLKARGHITAAVSDCGHYGDGQPRVIGLIPMRNIRELMVVSSTQERQGGNFAVLEDAIAQIGDLRLAEHVELITIVIPMWGGSRGHKLGQDPLVGIEIQEAEASAEKLSHEIHRLQEKLTKLGVKKMPKFRVITADIHNNEKPAKVFDEQNIEFASADTAPEFAKSYYKLLKERNLFKLKKRIVVGDHGAGPRSVRLAQELLTLLGEGESLEIFR